MSDNPNEKTLAELDIIVGKEGFAADLEGMKQQVGGFGAAATESLQQVNAAAETLSTTMGAIHDMTVQGSRDAGVMRDDWSGVNEQIKEVTASAEAFQEASGGSGPGPRFTAYQNSQADSIANQDPNEMPGFGSLPGEDGGGGGSLFGAAHGIRAASGLANMVAPGSGGALTGGADLLYLTQGFRAISDILPTLNTAIEATPNLLTPLAAGFTSLGIPMAGLISLALPVGAAVGVMIAAITSFVATIKTGADGIAADVKQIQDQGKLAGGGTTESLTTERDKLIQQQPGDQTALANLQAAKKAADDKLNAEMTEGTADAALTVVIDTLKGQIDAAQKTVDADAVAINNYNVALKNQQVSVNDAAEAARKSADTIMQNQQRLAQYDGMNVEQANGQISKMQGEQAARTQAIQTLTQNNAVLEATNDTTGKNNTQIDLNNAKLRVLIQSYSDAATDIDHLSSTVIKSGQAADEWAQHEQDLTDAGKAAAEVEKQRTDLTKQLVDAEDQLVKQEADAKQKEATAEQQYTIGFAQDTQARLDIATKESRQETQTKEQMAQADEDIRTKLKASLAANNENLRRQTDDDATKYADDRTKMVRTEADTEQENLENHLQKLADIQAKSHASDQQALLDRNFLQLAKNKESNGQAVSQENERYTQQQDDLREHLTQQEREQDIAYAQEQAKRQIDFERKREDLELAAQREFTQQETNEQRKLTAQRQAEQQALSDLTTNEVYRLNLLRSGLQQELALLQQQEADRLAVIRQAMTDLGPTGGGGGSGAGGHTQVPAYAEGGDFAAGQAFQFNEPGSTGRERVNIGSTSFGANTAALVIPFGSGSVNSGKGGGTNNFYNTWQISGASNPDQIVNLAIGKMQDMLEGVTD